MTTVFISHSTRDSGFAKQKLKPYLESHGMTTWFSDEDIPSAADWERNIRRALRDSQWYVVVLSPDAVTSEWVQAEVHWALEKRKGRVIPVMIRDCDPADLHLKLMRIQYIDFRADPSAAAQRLLEILQEEQIQGPNGPAPVGFAEKETTIIDTKETRLRLTVVTGPQKGASLDVRVDRGCIIGRGKEADLRLRDDCISRRHARLSLALGRGTEECLITDLESANGTFVNECRIVAPKAIAVGDLIDLGGTRLRVVGIS